MATLQKFKLLTTQCVVAQNPTRSPRTSPLVQLRRKKTTLRMLFTHTSSSSSSSSGRRSPLRNVRLPPQCFLPPLPEKKRDTLMDLFVSSPPPFDDEEEENKGNVREMIGEKCEVYKMRVTGLGCEPTGSPRPGWIGFRHRSSIRRVRRPMLPAIPEDE